MKIERKFTTEATGAYGAMDFTITTSEIRNPDGKVVFRNDAVEVPEGWSQVASRRARPEVFPQGGRSGRAEARQGKGRARIPVALGPR